MLLALFACQEPFGTDRHDLVGFRIAAIEVRTIPSGQAPLAGTAIEPRVAMIVDGRPWSSGFVDLAWFWVETPDEVLALNPLSEAAGTGPLPVLTVPEDKRLLAVVAKKGEAEQRAFVELAEAGATFSGPTAVQVARLPLSLSQVEGPELLLEARQELEPEPSLPDALSPGDFVRLEALVEGDPLIRWMATAGTFFELERHVADWAAAELRLDEDEVEEGKEPIAPGWVTVLALGLGEPGETAFHARDLPVGVEPRGVWVGDRFVPTDVELDWQPGSAVRGTLVADDASPFGLSLQGARLEPAQEVTDYGTPSLTCLVTRDGPLDPDWWLMAICEREMAVGTEVVVLPDAPGRPIPGSQP